MCKIEEHQFDLLNDEYLKLFKFNETKSEYTYKDLTSGKGLEYNLEGIKDLEGKTISKIIIYISKKVVGNDIIKGLLFITDSDDKYLFYHEQNCCEYVRLYDIDSGADIKDALFKLIGNPIKFAECSTNDKDRMELDSELDESFTWTFYKIANDNIFMTMRWLGESNGYYSESISILKLKNS